MATGLDAETDGQIHRRRPNALPACRDRIELYVQPLPLRLLSKKLKESGCTVGSGYLVDMGWWYIETFRLGAFSMPWSEGYLFASSLHAGSGQMLQIRHEMFRAGLRHTPATSESSFSGRGKVMMYVMAHWPGQAPRVWKRQFYTAIMHGVQLFDLYQLSSSYGTTENWVG